MDIFKAGFLQLGIGENIKLANLILKAMEANQPERSLQSLMKNIFNLKKYKQEKEKYKCGKDFSTDAEGFAYFCLECGQQCGSMICFGCFDPQLHRDHTYYLKDGVKGSCDCGDLSQWKEEGACKKHSANAELGHPISEEDYQKFKNAAFNNLVLLYQLYSYLLQCIKKDRQKYKSILNKIDKFGSIFFRTLYQTILNKKTLIELIKNIFVDNQINNRPAYIPLFSLTMLNQTAKKAVLLLNLIMDKKMDQKQTSRIELTSFYFKHYSYLIQSKFTDLSPHLLSNSRLILEFVSTQKDSAVFQLIFPAYNGTTKNQIYVHKMFLAYWKYYSHLAYLIELKEEAATVYWNNFAQKGGFQQFGNHCQAFYQNSTQIEIALSKYYSIQTKFFQTAIQLFTAMSSQDSFLKKAVSEIFEKIKKSQSEEHSKGNNYFRTYRRLMSLGTFLLLGKSERVLTSFIKPQKLLMNRLAKILKISRDTQAEIIRVLEKQLQMALQYMLNIPMAMQFRTIIIGGNQYNAYESLKNQYFMKNRLLFSLDVIYFRIILALLIFLRENSIGREEILSSALQKLLDKVRIDHDYSQLNKDMPRHTEIRICRFFSLLHEFMFSDQIDLLLSSHFSCFSLREDYKSRLKDIYLRFFISLSKIITSKVSTKRLSYIEIVEKLMFVDKKILEQLLRQKDFSFHPNSKKRLKPKTVQHYNQQGLNLVQYCPSLTLILAENDLNKFYSNHTGKTTQNQIEFLSSPFSSIHNVQKTQMAQFIKVYIQKQLRQSMNYINETKIEFQQLWDLSLTLIYKYSQSSNPKLWLQFLNNRESYTFLRQLQQAQSNKIKHYSILTLTLINNHKHYQFSQSSNLSQLPEATEPSNLQEIQIESSLEDKLNSKQIQIPSMLKSDQNNQDYLICSQCNQQQPLKNMMILTYVQYKCVPPFLYLHDLKSMYFQTCGHHIDKKCYKVNYSDQNTKKCCPICKRQWNFALPMKYQQGQSILQLSLQSILSQVLRNESNLQRRKQACFFELYKSLLVFLAISYHFNSSYFNCEVYKILATLLIAVPSHQRLLHKKEIFKQSQKGNYQIYFLSQKLSEWLNITLNPSIQQATKLTIEQISKMDEYIRNFFCQSTQTLLQQVKSYRKNYLCENLQVLQGKYMKCQCKQVRRGTYLIGLGKKEIIWCLECFKHAKFSVEEDQWLILQTTRGSLFLATKNDKSSNVLTKIKEKIFVNDLGMTIQDLTSEAIRLKIKYDHKQFKIDYKILYQVQLNFHLRLYRPHQ